MSFSIQKANFWKRVSALLFDSVLLFVLSLAIMIGLHAILKLDNKIDALEAIRTEYATEFSVNLQLTEKEYDEMSEEEQKDYNAALDKFNEAIAADKEAIQLNSDILVGISVSVTVSLLIGTAVWYFVIPLFLKHGRTLGKKIFGLAVIRTSGVKLTNPILFVRSLIGVYAIETMFPLTLVLLTLFGTLGSVGLITIILFAILQIGVVIYTKTNSAVHDLLADTVVVDMASQQIFESQEERIEFDKAEAARKAAEANGETPVATGIFAPKPQTEYTAEIVAPSAQIQTVVAEAIEAPQSAEKTEIAVGEAAQPAVREESAQETPAQENAENTQPAQSAEDATNLAQ